MYLYGGMGINIRIDTDHLPWWFGPIWRIRDYPQLRFENHISNLGTPRTQEISNLWNFPNRQLYQKLNRWKCWRIKYVSIIAQFGVLGVPRLLQALFLSILWLNACFLAYIIISKVRFDNFGISRLLQTNAFSMAQDSGFSVSQPAYYCMCFYT